MKKLIVTYTPNEWFKMMKESAADRPSAWFEFCRLTKIDRNPPELDLRDSDHDLEYLTKIFRKYGMRVPRELLQDDWDT